MVAAGALLGGETGAEWGGTIGSFVGPEGTVVGGVVGGAAGAAVGAGAVWYGSSSLSSVNASVSPGASTANALPSQHWDPGWGQTDDNSLPLEPSQKARANYDNQDPDDDCPTCRGAKKKKKKDLTDKQKRNQELDQEGKETGTPGDNTKQNSQFNDATQGLTQDESQQLHGEISKQNLSYGDIQQRAQDIIAGRSR